MKQGLFFENDALVYYENDKPKHAGVIQVDGAIYYISSKGRAVKGEKAVHRDRANGLLERGFYTFGEDYKLVEGSFKPVRKTRGYRRKAFMHRLKKSKVFRAVFKKKHFVPFVAVCLSIGMLSVFLDMANEQRDQTQESISGLEMQETAGDQLILPSFDEEILLCTEEAKQLYDEKITVKQALRGGYPYKPFVYPYQLPGESGTLLVSEDPDFGTYREFVLDKDTDSISIDNLKTGTTYYTRVLVDGEIYEDSFKTALSTRFVSLPDLLNTRDIGGYRTQDGRMVRQGLLIRGPEIDGLVEPSYFIPKDRMEEVQDTFGFVYEMDLRSPAIYTGDAYQSRFGEEVGHKFYDSPGYGGIFHIDHLDNVREIFRDLAVVEHYPMYLHCTYGTDRTGTVVFLLQGLLGMSEEDMLREYRLTGFLNSDVAKSKKMNVVLEGLEGYAGETIAEKVENYFIETVGLTAEEIESIRSIFLE